MLLSLLSKEEKMYFLDLLNELILINDNVNSGFLYTKPSILKEDN